MMELSISVINVIKKLLKNSLKRHKEIKNEGARYLDVKRDFKASTENHLKYHKKIHDIVIEHPKDPIV